MLCMPCTSGHLSGVNQASNTPDETGNIGACEAPSTNCTASNPPNSAAPGSSTGASGVTMQHTKATSPITTRVKRAPRRWPSTPPGNCRAV